MARGVQSSGCCISLVPKPAMAREAGLTHRSAAMPHSAWEHRRPAISRPTSNVMLKSAAVSIPPSAEVLAFSNGLLHHRPSWRDLGAWLGPSESRAPSPSEMLRKKTNRLFVGEKGGGVENRLQGVGQIIHSFWPGFGPSKGFSELRDADVPLLSWICSSGVEVAALGSRPWLRVAVLPRLLRFAFCQPKNQREPPRRTIQPVVPQPQQGCHDPRGYSKAKGLRRT